MKKKKRRSSKKKKKMEWREKGLEKPESSFSKNRVSEKEAEIQEEKKKG